MEQGRIRENLHRVGRLHCINIWNENIHYAAELQTFTFVFHRHRLRCAAMKSNISHLELIIVIVASGGVSLAGVGGGEKRYALCWVK